MKMMRIFLLGLLAAIAVVGRNDSDTTLRNNGITIKVYKQHESSKIVTLKAESNEFRHTYCFQFLRVFESEKNEEVKGSSVDLTKKNCKINEISSIEFDIICDDVNNGILSFEFQFTEYKDGMFKYLSLKQ